MATNLAQPYGLLELNVAEVQVSALEIIQIHIPLLRFEAPQGFTHGATR